jgi:hypothetical protein
MSNDYIPQSDGKFLVFTEILFSEVEKNAAAWNLNPTSWIEINPPLISAYRTALTKAEDPNRGHADVLAKNNARNTLKKAVRKYVKEFLEYNSLISDEARERMGLPVHDPKPTPARDPDTLPVATVKTPSPGVIELHVVDSKSGRKAKPEGVHGFETKWLISDTPPSDWEYLIHSAFCTRTPLRLAFNGSDRGKTVYFALRWENTRGVKGPWTAIMNAIVP